MVPGNDDDVGVPTPHTPEPLVEVPNLRLRQSPLIVGLVGLGTLSRGWLCASKRSGCRHDLKTPTQINPKPPFPDW